MKPAVSGICFVVLTEKALFFSFFLVTAKQLHLKETQQAFVNFLCSVADQMGENPQLSFRVFYYIPYNFSMPSFKPLAFYYPLTLR